MNTLTIFTKSMKESLRDYWMLILTICITPFFVFMYFAMLGTSDPTYKILMISNDTTIAALSHFQRAAGAAKAFTSSSGVHQLQVSVYPDTAGVRQQLQNRSADIAIIFPRNYSSSVEQFGKSKNQQPSITMLGDMSNPRYSVAAILAVSAIEQSIKDYTGAARLLELREEFIGTSSQANDFTLAVPGLIVFSIIMLLYTASSAIIKEAENKTLIRLQMSPLTTMQFLAGITLQQLVIGLCAISLTFLVTLALGFQSSGSVLLAIVVCLLLTFSIIAISLITAAFCKTNANLLTIGTFPLFILMWFTGAMYPIPFPSLVTIAGRDLSFNAILPPTHAVMALNKIFIHGMGFTDILFELAAIIVLTLFYFLIGIRLFNKMQNSQLR